ncbi:NADPH-dependent FMN reductase [Hydrogenispora ethanolica]|uniref:NADPH-dependent FMN reductase n=1 Tax=Hydrogenispora ethanolica TaxID=1082276 RepID=A0A4V2QAZ0_HYDET|nr:flavodoxin family protein [Hydrogenispora ethanolica]TCL54402.1 NADPH-dependent FMN reductase [Hydrogenispora ethanolica]
MNRILGIVGSPRRNGNTHRLVDAVLQGARDGGGVTELIFLNDLHIKECDGCHACWRSDRCVKQDDMSRLYARIGASDAVVFGTPVYWYGPTALMKGFIDRFVYFNCPDHRGMVRGKPAGIVVPFEETAEQTAAPLLTFFELSLAFLEMPIAGTVLVPGVTRVGEVTDQPGRLQEAQQLGKRLAGGR